MAVSIEDVRHIAGLARLGLSDERAAALVDELNGILTHMDVLTRVKTGDAEPVTGIGASGTPLREDEERSSPVERAIETFAPKVEQGFFLVPRLATHEDASEES
jgi:aspartyl-tRNA(Asn)/glutamyl-tRNA(Gln) amidotransferase subunit C